jgi:hypothetical protein
LKIGITGTRHNITQFQSEQLLFYLDNIKLQSSEEEFQFGHGDCLGADVAGAKIADTLGFRIVCFPPSKSDLRGFYPSDIMYATKSYFARNRDIVDWCDILLVVPVGMEHCVLGGTWYTHDYAIKVKKPIKIFWPENKLGI